MYNCIVFCCSHHHKVEDSGSDDHVHLTHVHDGTCSFSSAFHLYVEFVEILEKPEISFVLIGLKKAWNSRFNFIIHSPLDNTRCIRASNSLNP